MVASLFRVGLSTVAVVCLLQWQPESLSPRAAAQSAVVDLVVPAGDVTMEVRREQAPEPTDSTPGRGWTLTLGGLGNPIPLDGRPFAVTRDTPFTDVVDGRHRLTSRTDARGHRIVLSYDENGRISRVVGPNDTTVTFTTDAAGRITSVRGPSDGVTYTYEGSSLVRAQRTSTEAREPTSADRTGTQAAAPAGPVDFAAREAARIRYSISSSNPESLRGMTNRADEARRTALRKLADAIRQTTALTKALDAIDPEITRLAELADALDIPAQCASVLSPQGQLVQVMVEVEERRTKIEQLVADASGQAAQCRTRADAAAIGESYNEAARLDSGLDALLELANSRASELAAVSPPVAGYQAELHRAIKTLTAQQAAIDGVSFDEIHRNSEVAHNLAGWFPLAHAGIDADISTARATYPTSAALFDGLRRELKAEPAPETPGPDFPNLFETALKGWNAVMARRAVQLGRLRALDCSVEALSSEDIDKTRKTVRDAVRDGHAAFRGAVDLPRKAAECAAAAGSTTTPAPSSAAGCRARLPAAILQSFSLTTCQLGSANASFTIRGEHWKVIAPQEDPFYSSQVRTLSEGTGDKGPDDNNRKVVTFYISDYHRRANPEGKPVPGIGDMAWAVGLGEGRTVRLWFRRGRYEVEMELTVLSSRWPQGEAFLLDAARQLDAAIQRW